MISYNKINNDLYTNISNLYNNFNQYDKQNYIELLKLCYDSIYQENIFLIIDTSIKFFLLQIIQIFNIKYWNNNYFQYSKEIQKLIILLRYIKKNNYMINKKIKIKLELILKEYNIINDNDIKNHTNVFNFGMENGCFNTQKIKMFFNNYKINFLDSILEINNIKIPNFLYHNNNLISECDYEFLHLLFKIYAPYLYYGKIFQEGYEYTISEKDIIFDCGGNMGLFALYCASKGAQVYCFEPMSYIRKYLKESQKLYPNNIHIIPYGIANKTQTTYFYQTKNPGASNSTESQCIKSNFLYKEKCKTISIDEFCKNTLIIPTFIKMDIEGYEERGVQGASTIIQNYNPIIHLALNHKPNDLYILPFKIYSLNNNYKFFHMYEGDSQSKFVLCK